MSSAGVVAAIVARSRREIQHHFFSEDAVRADRAVAFVPTSAIQARQFEKMLERGSIRREAGDRYWIDVVAYDEEVHARHRRAKVVLVIVIVVLAVALVASLISSGYNVSR